MQLPTEYLELMSDYQIVNKCVKELEVTNDCAERGDKLVGDFKDFTTNEEQRQFLFQIIEKHRHTVPFLTKQNLNKQRVH